MNIKNIKIEKEFWDAEKTKLKKEEWYKDGRYHRLDGPAFQYWYENGQKQCEYWYKDDKHHRLDGPAYQIWYENGKKQYEKWFKDDNYHRLDGPAYQKWYVDGKKQYEGWYKDDKHHRLDGPAYQSWHEDGSILSQKYYIDGDEYTEEEFNKLITKNSNSTEITILVNGKEKAKFKCSEEKIEISIKAQNTSH